MASVTHSWFGAERELPLDLVGRDGVWLVPLPFRPPGRPVAPANPARCISISTAVADRSTVAKPKLSMHPPRAVGAAGFNEDLLYQIGQPRMSDRAL